VDVSIIHSGYILIPLAAMGLWSGAECLFPRGQSPGGASPMFRSVLCTGRDNMVTEHKKSASHLSYVLARGVLCEHKKLRIHDEGSTMSTEAIE
jgi:hypothetical protein